jgi:hypothetical protein
MNKIIWKYELMLNEKQIVKVPKGAQILSLRIQNGIPCIWALVDPKETENESRRILIFGTGHDVSHSSSTTIKFIDTFLVGPLVFHVFELTDALVPEGFYYFDENGEQIKVLKIEGEVCHVENQANDMRDALTLEFIQSIYKDFLENKED